MSYKYEADEKAWRKQNYQDNKEKVLLESKIRYSADPEKYKLLVRGRHLKKKYFPHLTVQQSLDRYAQMFDSQKGLCAICLNPEVKVDPQHGKVCWLAVDHDPQSKHVRGLLCFMCNTNLGRMERNFQRIVTYLRNSKMSHVTEIYDRKKVA